MSKISFGFEFARTYYLASVTDFFPSFYRENYSADEKLMLEVLDKVFDKFEDDKSFCINNLNFSLHQKNTTECDLMEIRITEGRRYLKLYYVCVRQNVMVYYIVVQASSQKAMDSLIVAVNLAI